MSYNPSGWEILVNQSGVNTETSVTNVDTVSIEGLNLHDSLRYQWFIYASGGGNCIDPQLYHVGDSVQCGVLSENNINNNTGAGGWGQITVNGAHSGTAFFSNGTTGASTVGSIFATSTAFHGTDWSMALRGHVTAGQWAWVWRVWKVPVRENPGEAGE